MEKQPEDKQAGDVAREVGKVILSAIPGAGGPLQVIFENIFSSPLEKRRHAWLEQLAEIVATLQKKIDDFSLEKLSQNESFITVALQASQIAVRNHQQEKLNALRNAVLNSALPNPPDEDLQVIFLRLIDQLTPWHLRVLTLLDNPENWMQTNNISNPGWDMGCVSTVIEHCLPALRTRSELYNQIVRELQTEGLITQGQFLNGTMTGQGMLQSRTPGLGKHFLKFITEPN